MLNPNSGMQGFIGGRGDEHSRTPRGGGEGGKILDMTVFTMEMKKGVEKMDFRYAEWVDKLSLEKHEMLTEIMQNNQKYILSDNTIRKYAQLVDVYTELEAAHLKLRETTTKVNTQPSVGILQPAVGNLQPAVGNPQPSFGTTMQPLP